jgi:5-methylcytosine-specific restriction protein A
VRHTGFSVETIQLIEARSQFNCEVMAQNVCQIQAHTIHHRRPRGMGGTRREATNFAGNGMAVCMACHAAIESRRVWAITNGFLVRQRDDPHTIPVWWRCAYERYEGQPVRKYVLLNVAGGITEIMR